MQLVWCWFDKIIVNHRTKMFVLDLDSECKNVLNLQ